MDKVLTKDIRDSLDTGKEIIFMGHSHAACAFNDTIIENAQNLASPMEGYFFTYYKAKMIAQSNKKLKIVFIEFTNNQISWWAKERIWGEYLPNQLQKYSMIIDLKGMIYLLSKSPIVALKTLNTSLWKKVIVLFDEEKDLINELHWGGFKTGSTVFDLGLIDSLNDYNYNRFEDIKFKYSVSGDNLVYLKKSIKLLKSYNIKVVLIRSPVPKFTKVHNEGLFQDIIRNEFYDLPFIDLKLFPVSDQDFADQQHLNYSGSKKVSVFINEVLKDSLLETKDYQSLINNRMKIIN